LNTKLPSLKLYGTESLPYEMCGSGGGGSKYIERTAVQGAHTLVKWSLSLYIRWPQKQAWLQFAISYLCLVPTNFHNFWHIYTELLQ